MNETKKDFILRLKSNSATSHIDESILENVYDLWMKGEYGKARDLLIEQIDKHIKEAETKLSNF